MRSKKKLLLAILGLSIATSCSLFAVDHKEGGYAQNDGNGNDTTVYNFLKHFNYEQYYWTVKSHWTTNNNNRIDAMNFAIFSGHGNQWLISPTDGNVDLSTAGSSSHGGYGDTNLNFVAFHSCLTIPSPIEVGNNWDTNWIKTGGIFDGLHQAVGYRTTSYFSTDQDITDFFGARIAAGYTVWQSWFDAINARGLSSEKGSAVMHPTTVNDTYANFVADPPVNHQDLSIWYQN